MGTLGKVENNLSLHLPAIESKFDCWQVLDFLFISILSERQYLRIYGSIVLKNCCSD